MRNCAEIVDLLSEYLDRELPPDTCSIIQEHLENCADCREESESLRKTMVLCRQYVSHDRPRPLPASKQRELRNAFERVLAHMRKHE
jgi:anti-sigma factor RsiW